jgi:hypothetical protein
MSGQIIIMLKDSLLTLNEGIGALVGDVVNDGLEAVKVGLVKGSSESTAQGDKTLQLKGNTEGIESLADKVVDGARAGPGVVRSKNTLLNCKPNLLL